MTPDADSEQKAIELSEQLDAIFEPHRTGTNTFTFLLPQHTLPSVAISSAYGKCIDPHIIVVSQHSKLDTIPTNLLGGDRNIPPVNLGLTAWSGGGSHRSDFPQVLGHGLRRLMPALPRPAITHAAAVNNPSRGHRPLRPSTSRLSMMGGLEEAQEGQILTRPHRVRRAEP